MTLPVVTLIGLMGAGKTRVGQTAAALLERPFIDTDALIAAAADKPVAAIFADDGEAEFRRLEREAIRSAMECGGAVVSVGGGAVMETVNVNRVRAAGPVVWLYAEPATLLTRLRRSLQRNDRPLLTQGDPLEVLTRLLEQRHAAYSAAATTVLRTDGLEVDQSAALLAAWIRDHATAGVGHD